MVDPGHIVLTAVAVPAVLGSAIVGSLVALRVATQSPAARASCDIGIISSLIACAAAVDTLVLRVNTKPGLYIDEGAVTVWLPSLIAALCGAAVWYLRRSRVASN